RCTAWDQKNGANEGPGLSEERGATSSKRLEIGERSTIRGQTPPASSTWRASRGQPPTTADRRPTEARPPTAGPGRGQGIARRSSHQAARWVSRWSASIERGLPRYGQ